MRPTANDITLPNAKPVALVNMNDIKKVLKHPRAKGLINVTFKSIGIEDIA